MCDNDVIVIDGSYLEGGGQILRNALSYSCLLRRPVRVTNIRANRPNPGLCYQHLYTLNLLTEITKAKVKGDFLTSTQIEFHPGLIKPGNYTVNPRTAASVSLILQAVLPVLMFGGESSQVELYGGTNVGMSPQIDFMTEVFRPNLEFFGATFDFELLKRGYFPNGGGQCKVNIPPIKALHSISLTQFGTIKDVHGWCYVAGKLPNHIAYEMKNSIVNCLNKQISSKIFIYAYKERNDIAQDNGCGCIIKATTSTGCTIGEDSLGEKNIDSKGLGEKAAMQILEYQQNNICVDKYVQDQLIMFMALANGLSRVKTTKLTNHTRTAMFVANLMTGVNFTVEDPNENSSVIICNGIGYYNYYLNLNLVQ